MRTTLLLAVLLVPLPACAVAVGAAGGLATVKYLENQVVRDHATTVRGAYDAALAVLPPLGYPAPKRATLGPTEARIEAGEAVVAIAEHPGGVVRVAVRVGTFESADNRRRAELVHERMAARLAP